MLSFVGNIACKENDPKLHAHVVLGKSDGTAHGGYLQIDTLLVDFGPKGQVSQGAYEIDTIRQGYNRPDLKTVFKEPLRLDDADRRVRPRSSHRPGRPGSRPRHRERPRA